MIEGGDVGDVYSLQCHGFLRALIEEEEEEEEIRRSTEGGRRDDYNSKG